jgi:hypothetical protein
MAEIPDHAPILIKEYQICLYIKEVLIIWDLRVLIVYLLIKRTYPVMLRNSNIFQKILFEFILYARDILPI